MADSKVSALTAATVVNDADELYLVQGGASKRVAASLLNALSRYANVVVVDSGGSGDFTTLSAALAAITDASSTNRYGVVVMPGRYTITTALEITKDGVDILALVPGSVEIYATVTISGGMIQIGSTRAVVSESLISGIRFTHAGNVSTNTLKIALAFAVIARFKDCIFTKSLGSGATVLNNGHASSIITFENCLIEHLEVTASVRYALGINSVTTPGASPLRFRRCQLRSKSSSATGGVVVDVASAATYDISFLSSELAVPVGPIVYNSSEDVPNSMAIAHCTLSRDLDVAYVTNAITTPNNVVYSNL